PADLRVLRTVDLAADRPREHLSAEAQPQDGYVSLNRLRHQRRLAHDERLRIVERGELRPERHDQVVPARVDRPVLEVDAEHLDRCAHVPEPRRHVTGGRRLLVLEDQRAERAGAHADPPADVRDGADAEESSSSTCSATRRIAPTNLPTMSSRSSSVAVNAGANSV